MAQAAGESDGEGMDSVPVSRLKLALFQVRSLPSVKVGLTLLCASGHHWGRRDPTAVSARSAAWQGSGACSAELIRAQRGQQAGADLKLFLSLGTLAVPGKVLQPSGIPWQRRVPG